MSKRRAVLALLVPLLLVVSACSGDDDGGSGGGDPDEVLAGAKTALDETSGVKLTLETDELPDGVNGVTKASGVANHQPAFEGEIDVIAAGFSATVPVVGVDDTVYADIPFPPEDYVEVDPAEYGAPDPAALMDPDAGISGWLTSATDVQEGDQSRDGSDVLTTYTGSLAGSVVATAIPSADESGTFEVTFRIGDDGKLHSATLTGPFYSGEPDVTYDLTIDEYDVDQDISAP